LTLYISTVSPPVAISFSPLHKRDRKGKAAKDGARSAFSTHVLSGERQCKGGRGKEKKEEEERKRTRLERRGTSDRRR
jgi:hypothetical protein